MLNRNTIYLTALCAALAACDQGGDQGEAMSEGAPSSMEEAAGMAEEGMAAEESAPTVYVDHAMDEVEFELKKSIAGLEELAEDYRDKGIDPSEIEAQIAEKKQELEDL